MPNAISLLFGLLLGAFASSLVWFFVQKAGYRKELQEIELRSSQSKIEAQRIRNEAEASVEKKRKEILLQCRDETQKAQAILDELAAKKRDEFLAEKKRLDQKEATLFDRQDQLERKMKLKEAEQERQAARLQERENALLDRENAMASAEEEQRLELERIASLSKQDARDMILEDARKAAVHEQAELIRRMRKEAQFAVKEEAKELVVDTIERYAADYVSEHSTNVVSLPSEDMKGRIIGREGRNIRCFEKLSGVQVILDDTPQAVVLSSMNPIRREIARLALERLLTDGRIHPANIEDAYEKALGDFDGYIWELGNNALLELGIFDLPRELTQRIGRLQFRTSYGQNVLQHSMEVARIAGTLASELGLDEDLAKKAGLLHDIGKADDSDIDRKTGTHITQGVELAKQFRLHDVIVNAIESHHGDVEPKYLISSLVAAADAISAARPGARQGEDAERFIQHITALESFAHEEEGVKEAYAIQAGREVRIFVKPEVVDTDEMQLIAQRVADKIHNTLKYPGEIQVQVFREESCVAVAN